MVTTSYKILSEKLREHRDTARKKHTDKPILYEVEIKRSNSPIVELFESIAEVVAYISSKEKVDETLKVAVQVFVVLEAKETFEREFFHYVGKEEFYGGKRRLMYKKMQKEMPVG